MPALRQALPGKVITPRRRPPGRPRDVELPRRVLEAALQVYALHGWGSFNFETVSTAAGVGRPALYRRWADRSALLTDALLSTTPEVLDADLGSLHDELHRVLSDYLRVMQGNRGRAGQRLYLDRDEIPDVLAAVEERLMRRRSQVVSRALSRAAARAGRPSAVSDNLTLAFLLGGALQWHAAGAERHPVDIDEIVTSVVRLSRLEETR
jgi:AcrR family transcriptional regulator